MYSKPVDPMLTLRYTTITRKVDLANLAFLTNQQFVAKHHSKVITIATCLCTVRYHRLKPPMATAAAAVEGCT